MLGKLVKLVQENDIKTDADMDKTIDKAAGEVLEEATSKAKAESKANGETGEDTVWSVWSGQTRRSLFLGYLRVYTRSDCCSGTV